jgi:hypothetical protein
VLVPRAIQDPSVPKTTMDPELVARARSFRIARNLLDPDAFRLNVAVIKYERDGVVRYEVAANDPAELHSESVALRKIEKGDPSWTRTRILGVYSERQPCPNCARDLAGVRRRLKVDFPVYYSIGQWQAKRTRARELMTRYFGSAAAKAAFRSTAPAKVRAKPKSKSPPEPVPTPDEPAPVPKPPAPVPKATPEPAAVPKATPEPAAVPTATPAPAPAPAPKPPVPAPKGTTAPAPAPKPRAPTPKVTPEVIVKPRISRPALRTTARGLVGAVLSALLAFVGSRLQQRVTEDFIDWQVEKLQPAITKRLEELLPTGLALRDQGKPVYANITLRVEQDSSIDPDLLERVYGAPTVTLQDVRFSEQKLEGETGSGKDYDLFVLWEWNDFTSSIPLAELIEAAPAPSPAPATP